MLTLVVVKPGLLNFHKTYFVRNSINCGAVITNFKKESQSATQ